MTTINGTPTTLLAILCMLTAIGFVSGWLCARAWYEFRREGEQK